MTSRRERRVHTQTPMLRTTSSLFSITVTTLVVTSLLACQQNKVLFSELQEIQGGWTYEDSISFVFEAEDTARVYALNLQVIHDRDYSWENLYVMIHTSFPGDSIKTDILSLELFHETGRWVGQCRDEQCTVTIPLQERMRFPVQGRYGLTFIQHMRQEIVPGIKGLKLSVVEAR